MSTQYHWLADTNDCLPKKALLQKHYEGPLTDIPCTDKARPLNNTHRSHNSTVYLNTDFVYIKFVGYNLRISHHHYTCNCSQIDNISYRISRCAYDLFPYQIHLSNSNYSLVMAIKSKAKYVLHSAVVLFFSILQKKKYLDTSCIFFQDLLPYIISRFQI
jgi:hypothetical protein